MKSRTFHQTVLFVLSLALVASCAPAQPTKSDLPPLRVEFTEWWGDYTMIIAEKQGLFEKHGVKVEALYYTDFTQALPDLTAGKIDAGLFGITDVINTANITDIRAVAAYDDGGPAAVIAIPGINSVEELKGKRIGVSIGTTYEMFVVEMLATAGLTSSDVILLNFRPDQGVEALGKEVDAIFSWEPYTTEALAAGYHTIFSSEQLSNLYPDLITFRASVVEQRPNDVRAFLRAWFEAVDFRLQNPQEANQIIAGYFDIPVDQLVPDDELNIMTLADNQALYQKESTGGLTSVYDVAKINAEFMLRMGTLIELPNYEEVFDPSYLK